MASIDDLVSIDNAVALFAQETQLHLRHEKSKLHEFAIKADIPDYMQIFDLFEQGNGFYGRMILVHKDDVINSISYHGCYPGRDGRIHLGIYREKKSVKRTDPLSMKFLGVASTHKRVVAWQAYVINYLLDHPYRPS